jgi:hypothetical protein
VPRPSPSPFVECVAIFFPCPTHGKACTLNMNPVKSVQDKTVPYTAFHIQGRRVIDLRTYEARSAWVWLHACHKLGETGAIVFDIDDTILNGKEKVCNGFEHMRTIFRDAFSLFSVYIVTARPDDQHSYVMGMLTKLGFSLPPDRLYMLPKDLYDHGTTEDVEDFKWRSCLEIHERHKSTGGVIARFGDKLWDVAPASALHADLGHVKDTHTYRFIHPLMPMTYACKLPGCG